MELAIAGTELELFEEERVVVQSKGIEDVKLGLKSCQIRSKQTSCEAVIPAWRK